MIEFSHPLWFLALPLPFILYRLIPAYLTYQHAVKVPFFQSLLVSLGEKPRSGAEVLTPLIWQRATLVVSWICVVAALAQPMMPGEKVEREQFGRDVMVVVDLSGSMAEKDFTDNQSEKITRLAAAKQVLSDFVQRREGDRLGLIVFGDAAYLQTPFTADRDMWLALLKQTDVAMAGESTRLGDAIGLAIKVLTQQRKSKKQQVVIVLTDGNDTGSLVPPLEAAKIAKARDVRIHTIAMGDPEEKGDQALDSETLNHVAEITGGQAFMAMDQAELQQAYSVIDELEPERYFNDSFQLKVPLHHYLIGFVLILQLLSLAIAVGASYRRSEGENNGA